MKAMTNLDSVFERQRHLFADQGLYSQSHGFISHVRMRKLDHKEDWTLKNWCFWTVVLEKTLESPLDSKEIQPVHPKGILNTHWKDWCWSSSTLATWCKEPTHWKRPWCWEILKAGGEGGQQRHNWHNGRELEQTLGDSKGQGSLACCSP